MSGLANAILAAILAPAVPFFGLTDGFSGILGLVLIFFGLQQAWKVTARDRREVVGPLGEAVPPPLPQVG